MSGLLASEDSIFLHVWRFHESLYFSDYFITCLSYPWSSQGSDP